MAGVDGPAAPQRAESALSQHALLTPGQPADMCLRAQEGASWHIGAVAVTTVADTHLGVLAAAVICSRGTARLISIGLSCSDWIAPWVKTCAPQGKVSDSQVAGL